MVPILAALLLAAISPLPAGPSFVYLDSLLGQPSTTFEGFSPFRAAPRVEFGSHSVAHALIAEVHFHRNPLARISSVSFELGGRFQAFEALLGRDNTEQAFGRSYCYFEVYADGKRVYSSPAMRSSLADVVADGGFSAKVKTPQSVKLDVSGVETLKLVVQLPEFGQRGDRVNRAAGCAFGEARVTLKPGTSQPALASPDDAPYRRLLQQAFDGLLRRLPTASGEPLKVALAPFLLDSGASGSSAGWWIALGERLDRQTLRPGAIEPLTGSAQGAFLRSLPTGGEPPTREELARAGRDAGADAVLSGALVKTEAGWRFELELRETTDGNLVSRATSPSVRASKPM